MARCLADVPLAPPSRVLRAGRFGPQAGQAPGAGAQASAGAGAGDEARVGRVGAAAPISAEVAQSPSLWHGLARVSAWRSRGGAGAASGGGLPLAVDATARLLEVAARDAEAHRRGGAHRSEAELRDQYAMAIVRLVNGVADSGQRGSFASSVADVAARRGLSRWLVDVRHEASHNAQPSLATLRLGASAALQWLRHRYWIPQARKVSCMQEDAEHRRASIVAAAARFVAARNAWEQLFADQHDSDPYLADSRFEAHASFAGSDDAKEASANVRSAVRMLTRNDRVFPTREWGALHTDLVRALLMPPVPPPRPGSATRTPTASEAAVPRKGLLVPEPSRRRSSLVDSAGKEAGMTKWQRLKLDEFLPSQLGLHRLRSRWGPFLIEAAQRWDAFGGALFYGVAECIVSEGAAMDAAPVPLRNSNVPLRHRGFFLVAWAQFLISRDWLSATFDPSVAIDAHGRDLRTVSHWTADQAKFMAEPAPVEVLWAADIPLAAVATLCESAPSSVACGELATLIAEASGSPQAVLHSASGSAGRTRSGSLETMERWALGAPPEESEADSAGEAGVQDTAPDASLSLAAMEQFLMGRETADATAPAAGDVTATKRGRGGEGDGESTEDSPDVRRPRLEVDAPSSKRGAWSTCSAPHSAGVGILPTGRLAQLDLPPALDEFGAANYVG